MTNELVEFASQVTRCIVIDLNKRCQSDHEYFGSCMQLLKTAPGR